MSEDDSVGPVQSSRETNADDDDWTSGPSGARSTTKPTDETANKLSSTLTPRFLIALRENRRWRVAALLVATVLGVVLAWAHWFGLFVAGALVGLASTSVSRALVASVGVGLLVLLINVLVIPVMSVGEFVGLAPVSYVTIAAGLIAPLWGSLVRGVL